jgi:hypothetical protein
MDTPSTTVGPGIGAFIAFFALAVVLWLLMRNLNARMRRMAYREQQRVAELEAREAASRPRPGLEEPGAKEPGAKEPGPDGRAQDDREEPTP